MTIAQVIEKIDSLKPNNYSQAEKIAWLNIVEGLIYRTVIETHYGDEEITFNGYTDATPDSTVLIAYEPYDDLYLAWLESKIDYYNSEIAKYNNSVTRFNELYRAYSNHYNRTHVSKTTKVKYF